MVSSEQFQSLQQCIETQLPESPIFPQVMNHTHIKGLELFFTFSYSHPPKKQQQLLINGKQEHNTASIQTVPDFCKHSTTAVFKYLKDLYKA